MKECYIFSNAFLFLYICWNDQVIYISFYYCSVLQIFWGLLDHITSQRNIPLVTVYNLLDVFLNSVCWYLSDSLCIYIQSGYSPVVFLVMCLSIWYQGNASLIEMSLKIFPQPLNFLGRIFWRTNINFL